MNDENERLTAQNRYLNAKFIVGVLLAALVVLFLVQNVGTMEVRFLVWSVFMPRALLLFIVLAIGVIAGWFWHSQSLRRRTHQEARGDI